MGSLAYKDDKKEKLREEMLDGKIFAMSPRPVVNHNIVVGNIYRIFGNYLQGKPCIPFTDGVDVHLTQKDRVIPDVMIVCNRDIIKPKGIYGAPDLIVEVLSPGTAKKDKGYKKSLYENCGVQEYWIVNIDSCSIEVYLLKESRYVLDEVYTIYPDYELEDMTEEEKCGIKYEFTSSLFPDMTIALENVFNRIL